MALDHPTFLLHLLRVTVLTRRAIYTTLGLAVLLIYLWIAYLGVAWLDELYHDDAYWVESTTQCPLGVMRTSYWYVDTNQHEPICY
jgi:hypothetical protein